MDSLADTAAIRSTERWVDGHGCRATKRLFGSCARPTSCVEDRRPIIGAIITGPEDAVTNWMLAARTIGLDLRWRPLATRGERLVLAVLTYLGGDIEADLLSLTEVAEDGLRLCRAVGWAVDDEDAAYAELDARAIALAGDPVLVPLFESVSALNERTLDSLAFPSRRDAHRPHPGRMGDAHDCRVHRALCAASTTSPTTSERASSRSRASPRRR